MLHKLNDQSKKQFIAVMNMIRALKDYRVITLHIIVIALLALIGWASYLRFRLGWVWADGTGFGSKTLWDWLELLVIPFVLALGAFWLQRSERISDRKIAQDHFDLEQKLTDQRIESEQNLAEQRRQDDQEKTKDQQRETSLQAYFDKISELLLDEAHPLRSSELEDEIRVVARTQTLTTLRGLDPSRKGMLLIFLCEAGLITLGKPTTIQRVLENEVVFPSVIFLIRADLSGANLRGANLNKTKLSYTDLSGADLSDAYLTGTDLSGANLNGANLSGAYLMDANLRLASLRGANLTKAKLINAGVLDVQLIPVQSLEGATLPDGKKFDPTIHTFWKGPPADTSEGNGESH